MTAFVETWTGLRFLDPWFLHLAWLLPLAVLARRWRGGPTVLFAPSAFLGTSGAAGSWRARLLWVPIALQVLGISCAIVALARPVHRARLPVETEGIDILLCIDTSSSMLANDLDRERSRLAVARGAATEFVAGRPHDRVGLICFARYPDLRCPLTLDHGAVERFLTEVQTVDSEGPEDATGIGTAVARAGQVMRSSEAKSKVVILLTDGEENVATTDNPEEIAPLHAAQLCKDLGVRVYTIVAGIGSPRPGGRWVPLDTRQVKDLADRTGGEFFEAKDADALTSVYASIDRLEKVELAEPRYRIIDRFVPFLLCGLGFLVAGRLLRGTVLEVLP